MLERKGAEGIHRGGEKLVMTPGSVQYHHNGHKVAGEATTSSLLQIWHETDRLYLEKRKKVKV